MSRVLVPRYSWRVLDPVSGAELVHNLPHPHRSRIEDVGYQHGADGGSSYGLATIPLFPPSSSEYKAAKSSYDAMFTNCRMEAYPGPVGAGDPTFTGHIRKMPAKSNDYQLEVADSLWLLANSKTLRRDTISGLTDGIVRGALQNWQLVEADDFSSGLGAWAFIKSAGAGTTATLITDPVDGNSAAQIDAALSPGNDDYYAYNTVVPPLNYTNISVFGSFHLIGSKITNRQQTVGLFAAANAGVTYFVSLEAACVLNSDRTWSVTADIDVAAGSGIFIDSTRTVLNGTAQGPDFFLDLELVGVLNPDNTYTWSCFVNGADAGITSTVSATQSPTVWNSGFGGYCGVLHSNDGGGLTYVNQFLVRRRANCFQPGNIVAGNVTVNQSVNQQSQLDIINLCAATEGCVWKKNPKAGLYLDTLDYGPIGTIGVDRTASVRLEYGDSLVDLESEPNADSFATAIKLDGNPSATGTGTVQTFNVGAIKKYGFVEDIIAAHTATDYVTQRRIAQQLARQKGQPMSAKSATLVRTSRVADKFSMQDLITIHHPPLNYLNASARVLSRDRSEGQPHEIITLDQLPLRMADFNYQRMLAQVQDLSVGVRDIPPATVNSQFNASFGDANAPISFPNHPYKTRLIISGTQSIPDNTVTVIQLNSATYDPSGGFDAVNHRWTVKLAGYYFLSFYIAMSGNINSTFTGNIRQNSTSIVNGIGSVTTGSLQAINGLDIYYLNVGDLIDMVVYTHTGVATQLNGATLVAHLMSF